MRRGLLLPLVKVVCLLGGGLMPRWVSAGEFGEGWKALQTDGHPVQVALAPLPDPKHAHLSWNKVVRAPDGTVILACVAGEFHGNHGGGSPAVAWSKDGGRTFSPLKILRKFGRGLDYTCCGNLAMGVASDGAVILLAMAYTGNEANHVFGWRSLDSGRSWLEVNTSSLGPNLTGSVFGNIVEWPGRGLTAIGHYRAGSVPHIQGIWMASSSDQGKNWGSPERITDVQAVEPVLIQSQGRWLAFLRSVGKPVVAVGSAAAGRQYICSSEDQGRTWQTRLSTLDAEFPSEASLAAPCAVGNPVHPGELVVLTTERSKTPKRNSRIWLWKGMSKELDFQRDRVILEFPYLEGNRYKDLGYPWLLHLKDRRWALYFYHGESHGPSAIWRTEVEL